MIHGIIRGVEVVRYRVVVRGRVQGVWYRESCRRVADGLAVDGWVRNRGDGTVEAVVEGPEAAVEKLLAWMGEGPARAVVVGVDARPEEPLGEAGFRVR